MLHPLRTPSRTSSKTDVLILFSNWIFSGTILFQVPASSTNVEREHVDVSERICVNAWEKSLNPEEKILNSTFYKSSRAEWLRLFPIADFTYIVNHH